MVLRIEIAEDFAPALKNARANCVSVSSIFIDVFDSNNEKFCWFSKYLKCAEAFYTALGLENNRTHGWRQRRITVKYKGIDGKNHSLIGYPVHPAVLSAATTNTLSASVVVRDALPSITSMRTNGRDCITINSIIIILLFFKTFNKRYKSYS